MKRVKKRKIILVKRDGNCFFHCLAYFLKKSHVEIRKECTDYFLRSDKLVYDNNLDTEKIRLLGNDKVWNNDEFDFIPFIASELYKITIHIHKDNQKISFYQKSKKKEIHLRLKNFHFDIIYSITCS